jgi:hypothetical protein
MLVDEEMEILALIIWLLLIICMYWIIIMYLIKMYKYYVKIKKYAWWLVHVWDHSYFGGRRRRITSLRSPWAKLLRPYIKKKKIQSLVAHAYNPSYLGGCYLKDCGSRPAQANGSQDLISTSSWTEWWVPVIPSYSGGWVWEDTDPPKRYIYKT